MENKRIINFKLSNKDKINLESVNIEASSIGQIKPEDRIEIGTERFENFFLDKELFQTIDRQLKDFMKSLVPQSVIKDCRCNGDFTQCKATPYHLEMLGTYYLAAEEFSHLLTINKDLFVNRRNNQALALRFFNCFTGDPKNGRVYFHLHKLLDYTTELGFVELSKQFRNSDKLEALSRITDGLDTIRTHQRTKSFRKFEIANADQHIEFLEEKQNYLKEKLELDRFVSKKPHKQSSKEGFSVREYALFHYYLQAGGDADKFEIHPKGKMKAIQELIEQKNLPTNSKYFQLKYNEFSHHNSNRLNLKNEGIKNTVLNMLKEYPNSLAIAKSELT